MHVNQLSGVYAIIHRDTQRVYVGSGVSIGNRWRTHRSDLRRAVHWNPYLQNAWNKYGEPAFEFRVLETTPRDHEVIRAAEQRWIDELCAYDPAYGFNINPEANSRTGRPISEEHRTVLRARMLGNQNGKGKHFAHKLTDDAIRDLFTRYAAGEPTTVIAAHYDIDPASITRIIKRQSRANVSVDPAVLAKCTERCKFGVHVRGEANPHAKLTAADIPVIRQRAASGESYSAIARTLGVSHVLVRKIALGLLWAHIT